MRLCGPATLGEKKDRLAGTLFVPLVLALLTGFADALCMLEALTWVLSARACLVLALPAAFLRL